MNKGQLNLRTRNVEVGRGWDLSGGNEIAKSGKTQRRRNMRSHEIPGKHESERAKVG